jgi:hypothetical protein
VGFCWCGHQGNDGRSDAGGGLLLAVDLDVLFRGVFRVLVGMSVVCMRHVRMVSRLLVVAGFVMLCGLVMVVGSLRMVMGSLLVMMRCFLRHVCLHSGSQSFRWSASPSGIIGSGRLVMITTGSIEDEFELNCRGLVLGAGCCRLDVDGGKGA